MSNIYALLSGLVWLWSGIAANGDYAVVMITEYCRHGARTTFYHPNLNLEPTAKYGPGILTPNGMRLHYELGVQIRQQYPELFGPSAPPLTQRDVQVMASPVARTQWSALSQLQGIFPPGSGNQITAPEQPNYHYPSLDEESEIVVKDMSGVEALPFLFKFYPLEVQSNDRDFYFLGDAAGTCPKLIQNNTRDFPDIYQKLNEQFKEQVEAIGQELEQQGFRAKAMYGIDKWDIQHYHLLSDEMICYYNYVGKYYKGMTPELQEKLFRAHNVKFTAEINDTRVQKLRANYIARGIIQGMEDFINNSTNKKVFRFYSGHDTGLQSHMMLMDIISLECQGKKFQGIPPGKRCEDIPEFAAQMIYELAIRKNENRHTYYVRVLYNNRPIEICPDHEYCRFEDFKKIYSDKLFMDQADFDHDCGNKYTMTAKKNSEKVVEIFDYPMRMTLVCVVGGLAVLVALCMIYYKLRSIKQSGRFFARVHEANRQIILGNVLGQDSENPLGQSSALEAN